MALRMEKAGAENLTAVAALSLGHSIGLGIARFDRMGELSVTAPNFGHMLNASDGKLCRCGAQGCIEASAGFYGILRTAFEVPPDTILVKFVSLAEMDKIALRARQGHRMSEYAFRQAGLALGHFVNPLWFWLSAFAGANMVQAAFTGFCPAAMLFRKLGLPAGNAFR